MTRWLWARAAAVVLACGTFTVAQSPAPLATTPAPAPREGDIFTFRTAGQPERKVKITRVTPFADGDALADVEDLATGAKYTIPAKVLMASARSVARVPEKVSATPPSFSKHADPNGWPKKPTNPSHVKPTGFPTSLPTPTPTKGTQSPFAQRAVPTSPKSPATTGSSMLHGVGASQPPLPMPSTVTYPTGNGPPMPESPRIAPVPELPPPPVLTGPSEPKVLLAPVTRDTNPIAPPTLSGPIAPGRIAEPTLEFPIQPPSLVPGGIIPPLATEKPETVTVPAPTVAPAPTPAPSPPIVVPAPSPAPSPPIVEVIPQPLPVNVQAIPIIQMDLVSPPPAPVSIVPIGLSGAAAEQMIEETTPVLRDLTQALRPTVRERAATTLAEGRYGWRTEVKAELARAAAHDPATSVRAHCIRLLSKLGYHETAYLDQLATWAESDSIRVREAAREALAKLTVRN